jgi:hypothetical protein
MKLIFCDGGLCNRLNTLFFGLILRKRFCHAWEVAWPCNSWCGAPLEKLFDLDISVHNKPITYYKEHEKKFGILIHYNDGNFDTNLVTFNTGFSTYSQYEFYLNSHDNVFYYNNLIPNFVSLDEIRQGIDTLKISSPIFERANTFCQSNNIDETVYGIHIRKTDFGDRVNDEELFRIVSTKPSRFFVCSDDEEVNNRFATLPNCSVFKKTHFPQKRLESASWTDWTTDSEGRNYPYNIDRSEESVIEGLIDLLILSRTQLVDSSPHSTFLKMAGIIKRVGLFDDHNN